MLIYFVINTVSLLTFAQEGIALYFADANGLAGLGRASCLVSQYV